MNDKKHGMQQIDMHNPNIQLAANTVSLNLGEGVGVMISTMEPLDKAVSFAVTIAKKYKKRPFEIGMIG